jgi:signal transduction histidine kinase
LWARTTASSTAILPATGAFSADARVSDHVATRWIEAKKHAHAHMVLVSLRYQADRLDVVVQDDGSGASEALLRTIPDSSLHFGLRHIRQLVIDRGGSFDVSNGEETGLVVRVSLPLGGEKT